MSFLKKLRTSSKEQWVIPAAILITIFLYVVILLLATKPASLEDFIWLPAGTTKKIYDFYAGNLRGSFFTGFLALGGFLMSAKTFIIVNMKKEVYDSATYEEKWLHGLQLNGADKYETLFYPLRRLSNIIFYTIASCFIASVAQLTLGLFKNIPSVMVCFFLVIVAICFLMLSLFLIKKNLATMFDHLDEKSLKKMEADRSGTPPT
ncbi:hypothetical protein NF673_09375 [Pseudomonas moraviensis]|uniref:hypothetical protein n=1 Tax=Pseudomonas moraviensis TaxID=321662 RepID=UPI002093489A|nr:hypothetical protein [Pseudomonas moraviensis]UST65941.1 hypothetical protein NF673_09375 [Pseudomonas moraviensis]